MHPSTSLPLVLVFGCAALGGQHTFVDQAPASPIAASAAGTILFSSQAIPRGPTDASAHATAFDLDHPLYWRAFFKRSAANTIKDAKLACKGSNNEVTLDVRDAGAGDDAWKTFHRDQDYKFNDAFLTWTTWSTKPGRMLDHGDKDHSDEEHALLGLLARHPRGPVALDFRFTARCDGASSYSTLVELARGTITITVSDASLASYVKLNHLELTGVAFADQGQFHKIDGELQRLFNGKKLAPSFVVDRDWNVDRDALNKVLRRWARGVAVVHEETGGCTRYNFRAVEESMEGGSFVGTPRIETADGGGIQLDLEHGGDAIACQQLVESR